MDVLIRVLSPILPHTCDEALESLNSSATDSVQGLPALKLPAVACDAHWEAVINIRKLVLKELETAKANGIENSLDAGIQIPNTISTAFKPELADLFGVSPAELTETDAIKVIDLKNELRCERSWKRDETVKERSDGSILSERDYHAIQ